MNTTHATHLTTRAGLSPLRTGGLARTKLPRSRTSVSPATPTLRLEPAPFLPAQDRWPSWHRGPLDRLQSILTRFRD